MSLGQLPVVEKIAVELKRRLDLLADASNTTYNTKVNEVIRPSRLESYTPKDMQIVLTTESIETVPELMCPGNPPAVAKRITFNIHCNVMNDEKVVEPIDTIVHMFAADVEQIVTSDSSTWYTFDNNAVDAEFLSHVPHSAAGGFDGANVPIAIIYRTDENDPYQVRS
jgi:hypothetical protein